MTLAGKSLLITGANRGIGRALVAEALRRGAKRAYAASRNAGIARYLPLLARSHGAIVNVLSTVALGALPIIPAYSVSKAAAFSLTQSLRALLASRRVSVHAVLPGPTDTDMSRGIEIPKASPESVARAIFDGVEQGEDEIFPDAMSVNLKESWQGSALKAMERQNATFVQGEIAS